MLRLFRGCFGRTGLCACARAALPLDSNAVPPWLLLRHWHREAVLREALQLRANDDPHREGAVEGEPSALVPCLAFMQHAFKHDDGTVAAVVLDYGLDAALCLLAFQNSGGDTAAVVEQVWTRGDGDGFIYESPQRRACLRSALASLLRRRGGGDGDARPAEAGSSASALDLVAELQARTLVLEVAAAAVEATEVDSNGAERHRLLQGAALDEIAAASTSISRVWSRSDSLALDVAAPPNDDDTASLAAVAELKRMAELLTVLLPPSAIDGAFLSPLARLLLHAIEFIEGIAPSDVAHSDEARNDATANLLTVWATFADLAASEEAVGLGCDADAVTLAALAAARFASIRSDAVGNDARRHARDLCFEVAKQLRLGGPSFVPTASLADHLLQLTAALLKLRPDGPTLQVICERVHPALVAHVDTIDVSLLPSVVELEAQVASLERDGWAPSHDDDDDTDNAATVARGDAGIRGVEATNRAIVLAHHVAAKIHLMSLDDCLRVACAFAFVGGDSKRHPELWDAVLRRFFAPGRDASSAFADVGDGAALAPPTPTAVDPWDVVPTSSPNPLTTTAVNAPALQSLTERLAAKDPTLELVAASDIEPRHAARLAFALSKAQHPGLDGAVEIFARHQLGPAGTSGDDDDGVDATALQQGLASEGCRDHDDKETHEESSSETAAPKAEAAPKE